MLHLVVHLSDIHLSSRDDRVLTRLPRLAEAITGVHPAPDHVVLAVTGDVANTGAPDEYSIAADALRDILDSVQRAYGQSSPVRLHVVAVPGNHDCDFSGGERVRERIMDGADESTVDDAELVAELLKVQAPFFRFLTPSQKVSRARACAHVTIDSPT